MRTGEAKFDKIVGENKQSAVRTVTFWKGAQRSWELQSGHPPHPSLPQAKTRLKRIKNAPNGRLFIDLSLDIQN